MIGLTQWTDTLRTVAPPPLNLGGLVIGGNALQFVVTGFGIYVLLNWLQSLRLRDRPAFAIIARTPALILLFAIAALQIGGELRRDGVEPELHHPDISGSAPPRSGWSSAPWSPASASSVR